ncbi:hypothetical protein IGI04_002307 [Brassica rapa subsp. trilocularis]|uniref:Uncharacterized protein n=1 Tax=Brassica rapa subsp. trilocularis TaxID=1813537 RepID=A0ABQ7NV83_BRACM|nr:hypothetical protein IGI04_002307 [Brassica rapa subsp. trilocularis]
MRDSLMQGGVSTGIKRYASLISKPSFQQDSGRKRTGKNSNSSASAVSSGVKLAQDHHGAKRTLFREEKIAIISSNGCRKSILLKLIISLEKAMKGEVVLGEHNVVPNYFEQFQAKFLCSRKVEAIETCNGCCYVSCSQMFKKKTAVWTIILQPHDMYCHSCNRCRHVILRLFERLLMELGFRIAVFVVFDSASNLRWLSQIRQKQLDKVDEGGSSVAEPIRALPDPTPMKPKSIYDFE